MGRFMVIFFWPSSRSRNAPGTAAFISETLEKELGAKRQEKGKNSCKVKNIAKLREDKGTTGPVRLRTPASLTHIELFWVQAIFAF